MHGMYVVKSEGRTQVLVKSRSAGGEGSGGNGSGNLHFGIGFFFAIEDDEMR